MLCRDKLVIKKALVDLWGPAFGAYLQLRPKWALQDCFRCEAMCCPLHHPSQASTTGKPCPQCTIELCSRRCMQLAVGLQIFDFDWHECCPATSPLSVNDALLLRAGALAPSNSAQDPLPTLQTSHWPWNVTMDSPSTFDGGAHLRSVADLNATEWTCLYRKGYRV